MDEKKSPAPADHPSPPAPCNAPAPYAEAVHFLLRVMRRHHACVERGIADMGIHHSQHRMLMKLARCDHAPSQKELAEAMCISPAAVATTLKKLEKEGYITRAATDEDNRCNRIQITEQGLAKVLESREIFDAVDRTMFEGMTDEELRVLSKLIRRMDENLDTLGIPDPCCRKRGD